MANSMLGIGARRVLKELEFMAADLDTRCFAGTAGTAHYEERIVVRHPEDWQNEAEAIRCARARQGQGVVVAIDGVPL